MLHREAMSTRPEGFGHDEKPARHRNRHRRRRRSKRACGARHLIVTLAFTTSCCLSGVVFGWPALAVALKREGAYADKCADDDDECKSQEVALARVFTIGVLCMFGARLPVGLALDRLGARVTVVITLLGAAIGALLFADAHYAVGFALITGCANGVHVGSMHLAQLFPGKGGLGDDDLQWGAPDGVPCIFGLPGDLWQWRVVAGDLSRLCGVSGGLRSVTWLRHPASIKVPQGRPRIAHACAVPCLRAHQIHTDEEKPGFVASSKAVIKHTVFLPLLTYKATILLSLQFFVAMLQPRFAEDGRNHQSRATW